MLSGIEQKVKCAPLGMVEYTAVLKYLQEKFRYFWFYWADCANLGVERQLRVAWPMCVTIPSEVDSTIFEKGGP